MLCISIDALGLPILELPDRLLQILLFHRRTMLAGWESARAHVGGIALERGANPAGPVGLLLDSCICEERQVAHNQRALAAAHHRTGVMQYFFQSDRNGARVPKHDHPKRIAHQYDWNARPIDDLG